MEPNMGNKILVLIVEDEEHIRKIVEYNLKADGFEVYMAEDGQSGLEMALEHKPDVILLDWMMPEMDGVDVLKELRTNEKTEDITVFMLTAKTMMDDVGDAFHAGADDYITKPFNPKLLGESIRKKLERRCCNKEKEK